MYGEGLVAFILLSICPLSVCPSCRRGGHVAQSVGHLTRKSEVVGSIPSFVSPSADSRGAVVSYW